MALSRLAESSPAPFIDGIRAAREKIVARSDEEGRPPESVFDFVQGITAVARSKPQQDARLVLEGKAKALLNSVR